ncbi:Glutamate--tRNA ligase 2 [[Clostridium] ultunense Esp]|nr:Glutamate--tRNA ligase 2 [[Clostridium] ultunense Esp]
MEGKKVRVRFAPSPTGALHIGGARTAYFNWLFARKTGGRFILRIDDTDKSRSTEESYRKILEGLRWLGLNWDEGPEVGGPFGPYRQSERQSFYEKEFNRLLSEDKIYPCFCTPEQLEEDRKEAIAKGEAPRYAGRCARLTKEEQRERLARGEPHVYRLRSPKEGTTIVHDLVRGDVIFDNREIDDFIIWKADGTPTYHFASCIDDALMEITHIIRAEEHLSNTPRHIALFHALGAPVPHFAHVPMILAPDRSKLSKRHGATSVEEYREAGILPEALINYLLLLGFTPANGEEILSREEAISSFELEKVTKHSAIYDIKKLEWFNAQYLHRMPETELMEKVWPKLEERGWAQADPTPEKIAWIRRMIRLAQERSNSIDDLVERLTYYFQPIDAYDEKGVKKYFAQENVPDLLERAADALREAEPFLASRIETLYRRLIDTWQIKGGELIHPTRLAISGVTVGPGLFDLMELLGREECQKRMRQAAIRLRNKKEGTGI